MIKDRLYYLDFIRAISVLLIVIFHFNTTIAQHKISAKFVIFQNYANGNIGNIGVSLFFIISGAALMYSSGKDFRISIFFKKRFFALFPMFWIAYFFGFLYLFYVNGTVKHSIPNINFLLTLVGMDGYMYYKIPNFYILGEWFLGCIILLYICFPLLRILVIKKPLLLLVCSITFYIFMVEVYNFEMNIDRNFFMRIPDLLIGMYFIQYIKKIRLYQFILSLCVTLLFLYVPINIDFMYKVTIIGFSIFFILTFVAQNINSKQLNSVSQIISRYSYAIFLTHHVIMSQVLLRFKGQSLSTVETYCLLIISLIVIALASVCLQYINGELSRNLFKRANRETL